jgi:hypothetical protein
VNSKKKINEVNIEEKFEHQYGMDECAEDRPCERCTDCAYREKEMMKQARRQTEFLKSVENDCIEVNRGLNHEYGVRGGLVLPADEASPAETPMVSSTVEIHLGEEDQNRHMPIPKFIDGYEIIDDEVKLGYTTNQLIRELLSEEADICEEIEGDGSTPEDLYVNEDEWEDIMMTLTADSGAGNHVMAREDAPGYQVQPSEGSKRGKGFVGVDGVRIPNEGEVEMNLAGPQGKFKSTFQVAKVTRPLMSIARICDRGHKVVFEKGHASVLNSQGQEICRFARRGNLYMIDVKLRAPGAGFTRRG